MSFHRSAPRKLPAKLLAIRQAFGASQSQLIKALDLQTTTARISEYETGAREPNLFVLLAYANLSRVRLELIVNDQVDLFQFRDALARKFALTKRDK
jgi:transcriptional regulator with XRE-family HTH domain